MPYRLGELTQLFSHYLLYIGPEEKIFMRFKMLRFPSFKLIHQYKVLYVLSVCEMPYAH